MKFRKIIRDLKKTFKPGYEQYTRDFTSYILGAKL